jgi:hypothetical protein
MVVACEFRHSDCCTVGGDLEEPAPRCEASLLPNRRHFRLRPHRDSQWRPRWFRLVPGVASVLDGATWNAMAK